MIGMGLMVVDGGGVDNRQPAMVRESRARCIAAPAASFRIANGRYLLRMAYFSR